MLVRSIGILAVAVGGILVARRVIVQRVTPDLVAGWLRNRAENVGVPVTFGEISARETGTLHVAWVELQPLADGGRIRAEDVALAYDRLALRGPRLRLRGVRIARLEVVLPRSMIDPTARPADAVAPRDALAWTGTAAARLATLLAGGEVRVAQGTLVVPTATPQAPVRFTGQEWLAQVAPDGNQITATGEARSTAEPAGYAAAELIWRRDEPVRAVLQGAIPDVARAWEGALRVWPGFGAAPVTPQSGAFAWQARLDGIGRADWQAEGNLAFSGLTTEGGPTSVRGLTGTSQWKLGGDAATGGLVLESLTVESSHGDLTARGTLGSATAARDLELEVQLWGLSGPQLASWLPVLHGQGGNPFATVDATSVEAATVELRVTGAAEALQVEGDVRAGRGAFRVELEGGLPYMDFVQLTAPRAAFTYDVARRSATARLEVEDGTARVGSMGLAARNVHGTLILEPDHLRLAPVLATLPGAQITVTGTLPLRPGPPLDLRVEAAVTDMRAATEPFDLPPSFTLAGPARLTATVTGPVSALESSITMDATGLDFAVGQVAEKRAGERALLTGTFRRRGGRVRGDLRATLRDAQLRGVILATPRETAAAAPTPTVLATWDLLIGMVAQDLPLSTLRRVSPVTRILHGYGDAAVTFLFEATADGRRLEAWMDAKEVRCEFPRSPVQLALSDSLWHLTSDLDRRVNALDIDGGQLDLLDPLTPVGERPPHAEARTRPVPLTGWETSVDFTFDRATWRRLDGEQLTGRLSAYRGNVSLEEMAVQAFGGAVTGEVSLDPRDAVSIVARWTGCDVNAALAQFYEVDGAARGKTHGQCRFTGLAGAWPQWQGDGHLTVDLPWADIGYFSDGASVAPVRTVAADFASARFTFTDGRFDIPQLRIERPGVSITGYGNVFLNGDMRLKCYARVDNALIERLPLLARVQYARPYTPDSREVEFTLRDNIRHLRPKIKRTSVPFMLGDLGVGSVTRSGRALLDLLGF